MEQFIPDSIVDEIDLDEYSAIFGLETLKNIENVSL